MTNAFTTLWEYAFITQDWMHICSWNPPVEQLMSLSANQQKDNCAAWTNTLRKTRSWVCLHKTCCFSCRQVLKTPWIDKEFSYSVDIFLLKREVGAELKVIKPKAFILYHILFKPCLNWCPQVGVLKYWRWRLRDQATLLFPKQFECRIWRGKTWECVYLVFLC